jgi:hypothetical protein
MTVDQIDELGFVWEQLPSGNWNLWHRFPFEANGLKTITAHRGQRMMTFFHKTKEEVARSILTLSLLD